MHIGLGTASFGTSIPEQTAHEILNEYVGFGGTVIDTANNYAFWAGKGGESEAVVGAWLATFARERVEIHTKIGAQPTDGVNLEKAEGLSKEAINSAITASLSRLNTDYIDVLYAHIDDESTPLLETWTAFSELKSRGVVKHLGISNYSAERVEALGGVIEQNNLAVLDFAQYRHSIIAPREGADFGIQLCFSPSIVSALKNINPKVQRVAYSPLLDGAFEVDGALPDNYDTEQNKALIKQLQHYAQNGPFSPSALVLKRISDAGIMPLTMTGKIERLRGNLSAFLA